MPLASSKLKYMNKQMKPRPMLNNHRIYNFIFSFIFLNIIVTNSTAQTVGQNDTIIIDRILAVVGSHPILQSDVENTYIQNQAAGVQLPGDEKCSILEDIMASKLLLDQSELDSIEVTDKQVEVALQRRLDYFILKAGSQEAIEEYFKKSMPEIKQDFFPDVKEQLLTDEMKKNLTSDVKVTPSEVQKFYKKIPRDEAPRIPEQLEIRQIVLKPKVSEEEKQRVIDQLNTYREQILAGKSMATLAILYSDDPASRSQGGEMGYFSRADLVPEFTAVAFNLRGDETSRVVKTEYGYHLIQVIDRKGESINARHILLRPKESEESKRQTRMKLDSIAKSIRAGESDFNKSALQNSADEKTFANGGLMININNGTTKFEPKEIPPEMLVEINKLKVGEISDPFESKDDNMNTVYKIISIKSRLNAHQADIKTDYQYIQQLTLQNKQAEALNDWLVDKQKNTFIKINKDYQGCEFRLPGWVK